MNNVISNTWYGNTGTKNQGFDVGLQVLGFDGQRQVKGLSWKKEHRKQVLFIVYHEPGKLLGISKSI